MTDKTLSQYYHELTDLIERKRNSDFGEFPTTVKSLDDIVRLDRGQVMVIGGGPGSGKTSLGLQMAYHISNNQNLEVLFLSLEMTGAELLGRIMCNSMDVNNKVLRTGDMLEGEVIVKHKMESFEQMVTKNSMNIVDDRGYKFSDIEKIINESYETKKPDIMFLDFLQLIDWVDTNNQNAVIVSFIRKLTEMAKKHKIAIVLLSQLRRQPSGADARNPSMHDLLGSGAIEQCAHIILVLYRKALSDGTCTHHVSIEKNRMGEVGANMIVNFDGAKYRFSDLADSMEKVAPEITSKPIVVEHKKTYHDLMDEVAWDE